jgi:hypothetical protein
MSIDDALMHFHLNWLFSVTEAPWVTNWTCHQYFKISMNLLSGYKLFFCACYNQNQKRDPIKVGHNMKRCVTEHDHRDNDVRQATNQVGFGGPLCSWREMEAGEFLPDGQRVGQTPPHSGSISPSTPSSTGSQTVAKSRLAAFGISTSNGRGLS